MGKINVYDKIMIETYKKENVEIKEISHKSLFKISFRNVIHSLLRRAEARERERERESAQLFTVYLTGKAELLTSKSRSRTEYLILTNIDNLI